jgi:hypothetical protein
LLLVAVRVVVMLVKTVTMVVQVAVRVEHKDLVALVGLQLVVLFQVLQLQHHQFMDLKVVIIPLLDQTMTQKVVVVEALVEQELMDQPKTLLMAVLVVNLLIQELLYTMLQVAVVVVSILLMLEQTVRAVTVESAVAVEAVFMLTELLVQVVVVQ